MFVLTREPVRRRGLVVVAASAVVALAGAAIAATLLIAPTTGPTQAVTLRPTPAVAGVPSNVIVVPANGRAAAVATPVTQAANRPTVQVAAPEVAQPRSTSAPTFDHSGPDPAVLQERLRVLQASPPATEELKALPLPDEATEVQTDTTHLLNYHTTSSPKDVVAWYAKQLREAGYTIDVAPVPEELPMRVIQFTTPDGRTGQLTAFADEQTAAGTGVQVVVR